MNKGKRALASIMLVLFVVDPIGYFLSDYGIPFAYAYEFDIWKYKIIFNPVVEEEIINEFTETHVFDMYIDEYNKQEKITSIVAKLGYERIGIINTDNNFIYTIYLNEQGKITKVVDGFDDVDFIAELSIKKIERLAREERFEDLFQEVKVPFVVKIRMLKEKWL